GSFGDRHMSGARYEPNWPSASRLRLVDNFNDSTGEVAVSCPAGGGASSDGPAGPRERGRLLDGEIAGLGTLAERVEIDRCPPHLLSRGKATRSPAQRGDGGDRKSTRLNSSHGSISYAVFCLKKKD